MPMQFSAAANNNKTNKKNKNQL